MNINVHVQVGGGGGGGILIHGFQTIKLHAIITFYYGDMTYDVPRAGSVMPANNIAAY